VNALQVPRPGEWLGCGLDSITERGRVHTGTEAHKAYYPIGTGDSFPAGKAVGEQRSLPSSTEIKNAWSYTVTPTYVFMACG